MHLRGQRDPRVFRQEATHADGDLEPLACGADRGGEQILPGQRTEFVMRLREHREGAGHSRRAAAAHGLKEWQRLAMLIQEHVGCRAGRRPLAPIER